MRVQALNIAQRLALLGGGIWFACRIDEIEEATTQ